MKTLTTTLAVAMFFSAAIAAQPVSAQTYEPQGSWSDSCRNSFVRGSTFVAECRRDDDSWARSSIDLSQCPSGSVANQNGQLVCDGGSRHSNRGNGWHSNAQLPGGSWNDSCRNASMRGGQLTASCMNDRGSYSTSTLDTSQCRAGMVANRNGSLACQYDQR